MKNTDLSEYLESLISNFVLFLKLIPGQTFFKVLYRGTTQIEYLTASLNF